jgi:predicted PilT family ATPase
VQVRKVIQIPVKVRSFVIGKGGETIRQIEENSGAKIVFPKPGEKNKESSAPEIKADGGDDDDDDEEEQVEVTLEGSEYSVQIANQHIDKIVADKVCFSHD